jgi:hypothetical protein
MGATLLDSFLAAVEPSPTLAVAAVSCWRLGGRRGLSVNHSTPRVPLRGWLTPALSSWGAGSVFAALARERARPLGVEMDTGAWLSRNANSSCFCRARPAAARVGAMESPPTVLERCDLQVCSAPPILLRARATASAPRALRRSLR